MIGLLLLELTIAVAAAPDCMGVEGGKAVVDDCNVCGGDSKSCIDCAGIPRGSAKYDVCDVCNGDGSTCCGPATGRQCCINYSGVPDPYWDFVLLPVTIDNLIEKFLFTREVFTWLSNNLPEYAMIETQIAELVNLFYKYMYLCVCLFVVCVCVCCYVICV